LEQGAQAHGFEAGLWTLERVGAVVTRTTGAVLSRALVWRLLTGRLGWSLQRPERRAVERDESEIARWIAHEWPPIKKGAVNTRAWIVFLDESGVSLLPQIRRTYSPRGRTPLLRHRLNWKRASMAGALGYHSTDPERGAALAPLDPPQQVSVLVAQSVPTGKARQPTVGRQQRPAPDMGLQGVRDNPLRLVEPADHGVKHGVGGALGHRVHAGLRIPHRTAV
jgi:hypothetical protein